MTSTTARGASIALGAALGAVFAPAVVAYTRDHAVKGWEHTERFSWRGVFEGWSVSAAVGAAAGVAVVALATRARGLDRLTASLGQAGTMLAAGAAGSIAIGGVAALLPEMYPRTSKLDSALRAGLGTAMLFGPPLVLLTLLA